MSQNDHVKGLILTAVGGLVLTADIPLIKLAGGEPWSVLMLRTGVTLAATLLIWLVWRAVGNNPPRLLPGRAGAVVAALYGIGSVTFVIAVYNTSTANVAFLLAFNAMFAALLSWIFLKERPRPQTLLAMAAMAVGVLVIVGDSLGSGSLLGDLMSLASAFAIACALTISRASGEDMGLAGLIGVVLPLTLALGMVGANGYAIASPWWIVFNGAVVMPLAFYCLATGPRYISAPEVAMFYLLETVLAPVWVWMIFSETPSRNSLIGGAILVAALVAHSLWQLLEARRRKPVRAVAHPG